MSVGHLVAIVRDDGMRERGSKQRCEMSHELAADDRHVGAAVGGEIGEFSVLFIGLTGTITASARITA